MVQLFLGAMRVRTAQTQWATLRVLCPRVLLAPIGAQFVPVADRHGPPGVLVVVRVDAGVPLVLYADRTPTGLVLVHEKLVSQSRRLLALLCDVEKRCTNFLPRVGERAGRSSPAHRGGRERRAEAPLMSRPGGTETPVQ